MSVKAVVGIDLILSKTLAALHLQRLGAVRWGSGAGGVRCFIISPS